MRTAELVDALTDLVLPRDCIGCGQPRARFCESCIEACADLQIHRPTPPPEGFPVCAAFGPYAGALRAAIIAVKERNRRDLAVPLADLLYDAVRAVMPDTCSPVLVVPIPSNAAAARERGGDHMLRIARAIPRDPAFRIAQVLHPARRSVDAVGLGRLERVAARSHAFAVRRDASRIIDGAHLVIVDDLVTSGATLAAASGVLRRAGAASVRAATVAATARLRDP